MPKKKPTDVPVVKAEPCSFTPKLLVELVATDSDSLFGRDHLPGNYAGCEACGQSPRQAYVITLPNMKLALCPICAKLLQRLLPPGGRIT